MKKLLELSLGIVTSVGGYLEIGSIATSAQAGAAFGFQLLWALVLGTLCIIVLVEMSGRFAAVSQHTISDAMRARFGFNFFLLPLIVTVLLNLMVLSAEIGGVALAGEFATGIGFQWWAIPVGIGVWLLLWKGTFGFIEKGVAVLGLVTLAFVVAASCSVPTGRTCCDRRCQVCRSMTVPATGSSLPAFLGPRSLPICFCSIHRARSRTSGTKAISGRTGRSPQSA